MPGLHGRSPNPLATVLPTTPPRADVLLILECKESAAEGTEAAEAARVGRINYHGRY